MKTTFFWAIWLITSSPVTTCCSVNTLGPSVGLVPTIISVRRLSTPSMARAGNWLTPRAVATFGFNSGSTRSYVRSKSPDRRRNSLSMSSVSRHAAASAAVSVVKNAVIFTGSFRFSRVFITCSSSKNCLVAVVSTRSQPSGFGRSVAQRRVKLTTTAIATKTMNTIAVLRPYRPRRPNTV